MRVIIIANGNITQPDKLLQTIRPGDLLIAADGGARHCLSLNLLPGVVIGDMDSLSGAELNQLEDAGVEMIAFSARKDETDLELALLKGRDSNPEEVLIFGALGARWDMTISNLLLLNHPEFAAMPIRLVDGPQEISLLQAGRDMRLHGQPGDTISLIPLQGDAHGITTTGLEYPLEDGSLQYGASRGVSNVLMEQYATIQLTKGLLLVVQIHQSDA
jgi:thiamine pyrophosphokinase